MNPITIAKKQINDDLVIITRTEYDSLLRLVKNEYSELSDLEESIAQVKKGRTFGPFSTADELINSLKS